MVVESKTYCLTKFCATKIEYLRPCRNSTDSFISFLVALKSKNEEPVSGEGFLTVSSYSRKQKGRTQGMAERG